MRKSLTERTRTCRLYAVQVRRRRTFKAHISQAPPGEIRHMGVSSFVFQGAEMTDGQSGDCFHMYGVIKDSNELVKAALRLRRYGIFLLSARICGVRLYLPAIRT